MRRLRSFELLPLSAPARRARHDGWLPLVRSIWDSCVPRFCSRLAFFMNHAAAIASDRAHGTAASAIRGDRSGSTGASAARSSFRIPGWPVGRLRLKSLFVNAPEQARAPICYIPNWKSCLAASRATGGLGRARFRNGVARNHGGTRFDPASYCWQEPHNVPDRNDFGGGRQGASALPLASEARGGGGVERLPNLGSLGLQIG